MSVELWDINSKIDRRYVLIIIYKSFYEHEARAENYDQSHCYASCDPRTENQKYYPLAHTNCGYCGSNEIAPYAVRYWGNLVETGKVWSI